MNIFILLKSINKHHWYEVPMDGAFVKLDSNEAGTHLKALWSFYKKQNQRVIFTMQPVIEFPIWDSMLREMVIRKLVKVEVSVDKIPAHKLK